MFHARFFRSSVAAVSSRSCCWKNTSGAIGSTNTIAVRFLSKRTEFEEEFHLARALSKTKHTPEQQKKWEREMRQKERPWRVEPFELFSSAPYEIQALESIHRRSYDANVLLEIRDVRLPASSHHPSFTRLAKHRLHLICYTHADMIDPPTRDRVEAWTDRSWPGSRSIFVDTREHRQDLPYDVLYDSLMGHLESAGGNNVALTVGVANTGKSSLLMCLLRYARKHGLIPKKLKKTSESGMAPPSKRRKKKKKKKKRRMSKAGAPVIQDKPGKTRDITEYMLREKPRMYFLDVPGVSPPKFFFEDRPEAWFGYAAGNLIPLSKTLEQDLEAQTAICDYVLHCLNRDGEFLYISKFGLNGPTDNIDDILEKLAHQRGKESEEKLHLRRCRNFLKFLNTGNLGPVILDDIRKPYEKFVFQDRHFAKNRDGRSEGMYSGNTPTSGGGGRRRDNEEREPKKQIMDEDGWSFNR